MRINPSLFDISPVVSGRTAVFPGDTPFQRSVSLSFEKGHHLALSSIETTVHVGAHTDAPNHYHPRGSDIAARPLDRYLGPCQVIEVSLPKGARIEFSHLKGKAISARRVLFKTRSFPDPNQWNDDFNSLSPELVQELADRGVILVGIDTPSIDPSKDEALESHQAVFRNDLAILEGVVLDAVPEGVYTLLAQPLRLEGADASPVRALLLAGDLKLGEEVAWKFA